MVKKRKCMSSANLPFEEKKKDEYAPTLKDAVEDFTPENRGAGLSEINMAEEKSEPVIFELQIPEINRRRNN